MNNKKLLDSYKAMCMTQDWLNMADRNDDNYRSKVYVIATPYVVISRRDNNKTLFSWFSTSSDSKDEFQMAFNLNDEKYFCMAESEPKLYFKFNSNDDRSIREKKIDITVEEFMNKYDEMCEQHGVDKIWR